MTFEASFRFSEPEMVTTFRLAIFSRITVLSPWHHDPGPETTKAPDRVAIESLVPPPFRAQGPGLTLPEGSGFTNKTLSHLWISP
jgi:hypothetical protein